MNFLIKFKHFGGLLQYFIRYFLATKNFPLYFIKLATFIFTAVGSIAILFLAVHGRRVSDFDISLLTQRCKYLDSSGVYRCVHHLFS